MAYDKNYDRIISKIKNQRSKIQIKIKKCPESITIDWINIYKVK
jgi:hypothetical protein